MKIGHEMILASAGSGKTYALTNRFVSLLAAGARPERIVALTFTRKAAGEFFDRILQKLARAAVDASHAAGLAREIGRPELGASDFLAMLRRMTDAMHRLRLGTFDGFFGRIAKNFPLELGLSGEFEILQDYAARVERNRVLRQMFERGGELSEEQREFIEAFKRATFGVDEKRLGERLEAFIDENQQAFLAARAGELWGNARRIWPEGCEWLDKVDALAAARAELKAWVDAEEMTDGQRARWRVFLAEVDAFSPGAPMGGGLEYVFLKALDAWAALGEGAAVLTIERKKQTLSAGACAALRRIVAQVAGQILQQKLEVTRGIHAVLASYEKIYDASVRRAGKLTFADVQRLLSPDENGGRLLSVDEGGPDRLAIDFRLDAEIDHWLLDEFQDTSFEQWSVLKNLIDEAVQDAEERRSFFYVGDVKQAIYAWRDGDPRLFREIFETYNQARPGVIAERHLVKSYRSGPPVIEMVNATFGERAASTLAELFPGRASRDWNAEWREHEAARVEVGGHAALLHAEDEEGRFATTQALLAEIDPLRRGLTVAVLVQKNDTAAELADYLRREGGWPAVAESDLHVCTDNPLGAALLALVKAAAHPGDSLAWRHLAMTPFAEALAARGITGPGSLADVVIDRIHSDGFGRTLDGWWREVEPRLDAGDLFSRQRARQFLAAAGEFDATGSRSAAEFIDFMERHTVRDADSPAVVRVMTVHKAKGLGFDLVILPDLEGQKIAQPRDGLAIHRNAAREVEWVMDLPAKDIAEADPVLAAHRGEAADAACYEKLSLLYVAMTRAARAMYAIIKPPKKASTSHNFTKLLASTLGVGEQPVRVGRLALAGAYATGDADWHEKIARTKTEENSGAGGRGAALPGKVDALAVRKSHRLLPRRPSDEKGGAVSGAALFAAGAGRAAAFGTAVHAAFARVEWADATKAPTFWAALRGEGDAEAAAVVRACVEAPALAEVWARRAGAEAWRERAFEAVVDGAWVTGVFDRVVVTRDAAGRATGAAVYDFKTDWAEDAPEDGARLAARYRGQLEIYRTVAARLAGVPRGRVRCALVLTATRWLVEVDAEAVGAAGGD